MYGLARLATGWFILGGLLAILSIAISGFPPTVRCQRLGFTAGYFRVGGLIAGFLRRVNATADSLSRSIVIMDVLNTVRHGPC